MKKSKKGKEPEEKRPSRLRRTIYLAPRILSIVYMVFISIFALDSFSPDRPVIYQILAFLIHLIPTYILILITVIAWRWETVGGALFMFLAFVSAIFGIMVHQDYPFFMVVSLPLLIIGVLYLMNGIHAKESAAK